jgi:hypothetical protein
MRALYITIYSRSFQLLAHYIYTYLTAVYKTVYVYAYLLNCQNSFKRKSCLPLVSTCSNRQTCRRSTPLIMDIFHPETCLPKQGTVLKTRYKFNRICTCHNSARRDNPQGASVRLQIHARILASVLRHLQFSLPHGCCILVGFLMILSCYVS